MKGGKCPACKGRRWVDGQPCATCRGRGKVIDRKESMAPGRTRKKPRGVLNRVR